MTKIKATTKVQKSGKKAVSKVTKSKAVAKKATPAARKVTRKS